MTDDLKVAQTDGVTVAWSADSMAVLKAAQTVSKKVGLKGALRAGSRVG